jgi:hypothetical protein
MPLKSVPVSNSELQIRINDLATRMDKGFDELKLMLGVVDNRMRDLEKSEAGVHPVIETRLSAAWRKIDEHETKLQDVIKALNDSVSIEDLKAHAARIEKLENMTSNALLIATRLESIAKWLLGIFTAIIIPILLLLLSGKATIIFK